MIALSQPNFGNLPIRGAEYAEQFVDTPVSSRVNSRAQAIVAISLSRNGLRRYT
jgi:hypothetical protein